MVAFDYRQAQEIRDALARHGTRYLFIGKSGAILLGFPDTTQDAVLFVEKDPSNGRAPVNALAELGFALSPDQGAEIVRGKDFVQLKNGPSISISSSRPTESSASRTRGGGGSKSRASPATVVPRVLDFAPPLNPPPTRGRFGGRC